MKELIPIVLSLTANGDPDGEMKMQTKGTAEETERGLLISYTEVLEDPDGGPATSTDIRLLVRENYVTMLRGGEYGSTMVFR